MSAGHTPGPWTVSDLYADDDGQPELAIQAKVNGMACHPAAVCLQLPNMQGMQMANARLIAAAPDLLEALTMVRDADNDCQLDGHPTIPRAARAKIDAAISKATGETP